MSRKKSVYAQRFHFTHMIGDAVLAFRDAANPAARVDLVWQMSQRQFSKNIFSTENYIITALNVPVDVLRKRIPRHVMARLIATSMTNEPKVFYAYNITVSMPARRAFAKAVIPDSLIPNIKKE